jgi:hypothetical protein
MLLVFVLGFVSCAVLIFSSNFNLEIPFKTGWVVFDGTIVGPSDYIGEDDIVILSDRVILRIGDTTLSSYADSGSMLPVLDEGANGIRVVPASESEIEVGDIVSFRMFGMLVVHRVVDKGVDGDGVYFITKGDSNLVSDGKIRFKDIEYVTIGVLY